MDDYRGPHTPGSHPQCSYSNLPEQIEVIGSIENQN